MASSIPVHIVEDHNEALTHIIGAIDSKILPYSDICMLHLDSHPELVLPNFSADLVFDKDVLLDSVSIADWILPAVYAGHLGCIVWIKPQWANQMHDGVYKLGVGKHLIKGQMRCVCKYVKFTSSS